MAVNVDQVPFNKIPEKWAFDPEIGPLIQELLNALFQLRNRGGGDNDQTAINTENIATNATNNATNTANIAINAAAIEDLQFTFVTTAVDVTTSGNQHIEATAPLTVTLDGSPKANDTVIVKQRTTGTVTINGNGNLIDGASTFDLLEEDETVQLVYSGSAWFIMG